jgi:hypothetical protein
MKRLFTLQALAACAAATAFFLGGCSTTETRISERPQVFQSLSPNDQALVRQGRIREGMTQDAVYIAWGAPNQRGFGSGGGRPIETWIYNSTTSGDFYPPYVGYGYGGYGAYAFRGGFHRHHGGHFRGGVGFFGGGYYPFYDPFYYRGSEIISYPERTVSFRNGRVIAYQFLPEPRFL